MRNDVYMKYRDLETHAKFFNNKTASLYDNDAETEGLINPHVTYHAECAITATFAM